MRFGPFELDEAQGRLTRDGQPVALQPRPLAALSLLIANAGRLVTTRQLEAALWPDVHVGPEALPQTVWRLRKALGESGQWIEAVPKRGYRFIGAVSTEDPADPLVGRHAALAELTRLASKPGALVVRGPGGIGKTTLVRRLLDEVPGVFVDLAGTQSDVDLVLAVARGLGLPGVGRDLAVEADRVGTRLAEVRTVLILDNVEQLAGVAGPRIVAWCASGSSTLIATSRLPLEGVEELVVRPLEPDDALHLYARSTGQPTTDAARALVERLDGNPLAISLAAGRAAVLGTEALAAREDLLSLLRRPGVGRHAALESTIAWSWALLAEPEQRALTGCALLGLEFLGTEAESLLGDALDPLAALVDHGLLSPVAGGRLRMNEAVAAFARARLAERPDAEILKRRQAELALAGPELSARAFAGLPSADRLAQLEAGLVAMLALARRDDDLGARAALAIAPVARFRGQTAVIFEALLRGARGDGLATEAAIAASDVSQRLGRDADALAVLTRAIERTPDPALRLRAQIRRAQVELRSRPAALTDERIADLGEQARAAGDEEGWLDALVARVAWRAVRGVDSGEAMARDGLAACQEPRRIPLRITFLRWLEFHARKRFAWDEARGRLREAADLAERIGATLLVFQLRHDLALIELERGNLDSAHAMLVECEAEARRRGDREHERQARATRALGEARADRLDDAAAGFRELLAWAREDVSRVRRELYALLNLGDVARFRGDLHEAEALLRACDALARERGIDRFSALARLSLAAVLADRGAPDDAEALLEAIGELPDELGSVATLSRAHVALARGDRVAAMALAESAVQAAGGDADVTSAARRLIQR